jgi:hypothetical protein
VNPTDTGGDAGTAAVACRGDGTSRPINPRSAAPLLATNADHCRPIPDIARRFAENIVKRMWPSLDVNRPAQETLPATTSGPRGRTNHGRS